MGCIYIEYIDMSLVVLKHIPFLPFLIHHFFSWTSMNGVQMFLFLFISGGRRALCNNMEDFGVMTVYVYNPQRWATITDFRGMTFARAQNEKDSYRFELVWCEGFGIGIWQAEHKSFLVLCFWNKNFQDFELGTCTTSCHHITRINKQDRERS